MKRFTDHQAERLEKIVKHLGGELMMASETNLRLGAQFEATSPVDGSKALFVAVGATPDERYGLRPERRCRRLDWMEHTEAGGVVLLVRFPSCKPSEIDRIEPDVWRVFSRQTFWEVGETSIAREMIGRLVDERGFDVSVGTVLG